MAIQGQRLYLLVFHVLVRYVLGLGLLLVVLLQQVNIPIQRKNVRIVLLANIRIKEDRLDVRPVVLVNIKTNKALHHVRIAQGVNIRNKEVSQDVRVVLLAVIREEEQVHVHAVQGTITVMAVLPLAIDVVN